MTRLKCGRQVRVTVKALHCSSWHRRWHPLPGNASSSTQHRLSQGSTKQLRTALRWVSTINLIQQRQQNACWLLPRTARWCQASCSTNGQPHTCSSFCTVHARCCAGAGGMESWPVHCKHPKALPEARLTELQACAVHAHAAGKH